MNVLHIKYLHLICSDKSYAMDYLNSALIGLYTVPLYHSDTCISVKTVDKTDLKTWTTWIKCRHGRYQLIPFSFISHVYSDVVLYTILK